MTLLKHIKEYRKEKEEKFQRIITLFNLNIELSDIKITTNDVSIYFAFKDKRNTPLVDYKKSLFVFNVLFPFLDIVPHDGEKDLLLSIAIYIKEENEEDLDIILSMDNDALQLYYELRK